MLEEKSMKSAAHRPIVLREPYPTADEVAAILGLSHRETKQLDEIMDAYFQQGNGSLVTSPKARSHRRTGTKVRRRAK